MPINHLASKWKKWDLNLGSLAMPVLMPSAWHYAGPLFNWPLPGLQSDLLCLCFPLEATPNGQFRMTSSARQMSLWLRLRCYTLFKPALASGLVHSYLVPTPPFQIKSRMWMYGLGRT